MARVETARDEILRDRYLVIVAYEGGTPQEGTIQLDCPVAFRRFDHFTIFWRGSATPGNLHEFINAGDRMPDDVLRTLFFFPRARLYLPAHPVGTVPSAIEQGVNAVYGPPRFLRYEIYPSSITSNDLQQTRYAVWAEIAVSGQLGSEQRPTSEVGIFTTWEQLEAGRIVTLLPDLIARTIKPTPARDVPGQLVGKFYEFLKARVTYE
jgi:hypothetical protein